MQPGFDRQSDEPLFPDIFWNRPTIKSRGGRLLVVGGHSGAFSLVQGIYQTAEAAGIGEVHAAMPDALRPLLRDAGFGIFLPSTVSGSLGRAALGELMSLADDHDAAVIGANLTTNSETGIMIESLLTRSDQPVVVTQEGINVMKFNPEAITGNPKALVVSTMNGLFDLAGNLHMPIAIRPRSGVMGKLEILHQLASISRCHYVVVDQEVLVSADGRLGLTPLHRALTPLPALPIGIQATMWLQHRAKPYEALMTGAYILRELTAGQNEMTVTTAATVIRKLFIKFEWDG